MDDQLRPAGCRAARGTPPALSARNGTRALARRAGAVAVFWRTWRFAGTPARAAQRDHLCFTRRTRTFTLPLALAICRPVHGGRRLTRRATRETLGISLESR